mmetsp:Transcript_6114/g.8548  ORF Transcript_6114/g.8548 Transcript_6114/m.8548 type:complete len:265 (-) Transcript_6114:3423-4217(-)
MEAMEGSGGALAAITTALDVDPKKTLQYCSYIARRCRDDGPRLTLRTALDEVLDEVIQDESITTLNRRLSSCFIAYFELFPGFKAQFVDNFTSKDDLMDVLRASCNIPFYFNGNAPCVGVRGGGGVDGFFTVDLPRFGCPPTGSTKMEIIVCPYPASQVGLLPAISTCNYLTHREIPQSTVQYELITPDLLGPELWPYEPLEVLSMSISAPRISRSSSISMGQTMQSSKRGNYASDAEIDMIYARLYDAGVEAVNVWHRNRASC